jgi:hypothetical protein
MTSPDDSAPPDAAELEAFERIAVAAAKYLPGLLSIQDDVKAVRFLLSRRAPAPDVERLRQAAKAVLECLGPCRLDHNGNCQEHFVQPHCPVGKLRSALAVPAPDGKEKL